MNKLEKLTKSFKEFLWNIKPEPIPGANNTFSGFRNRWVTFYPGFHKMSFYVEKQNFDVNWVPYDRRLHVTFSFIWGKFLYLPTFF